jgi:fatty-acyl-CoA synthase
MAMTAIAAGATLVIHAQVDPIAILDSMEKDLIVTAGLVPAVIQFLVNVPGVERRSFPELRFISYGASPIAEPVLRRAMATFNCGFLQGYGMTELAGACCVLSEHDHRLALEGKPHLLASTGRAIPGCAVKVVDSDGKAVAPGEIGEIVVRGDSVMVGYWQLPEATKAAIKDGWLHTGDAGSLDSDGYLTIRDRVKDMIVSGAENVYPAEIEAVLISHPGVADVSVIGVPDERWGETVMAVIVSRGTPAPSEQDLDTFCRGRLGGFKVPRHYSFIPALPRNAAGKVLKRELRARYWEGCDRQVN